MTSDIGRRAAGLVALVALQGFLAASYAARGTSWHYLLHSILGAGAGLVVAALSAARTGRPGHPVAWAVAGQLVSDAPDVLFVTASLPHRRWMDVFLGHIRIHTAPQPLLVVTAAFLLAGWGWWLASYTRRQRLGAGLALAAVALVAGALFAARPLPTRLSDYARLDAAFCGSHPPPAVPGSPWTYRASGT